MAPPLLLTCTRWPLAATRLPLLPTPVAPCSCTSKASSVAPGRASRRPALADRSMALKAAPLPPETLSTLMSPALAVTRMSLPAASVPERRSLSLMLPAAVMWVAPSCTALVSPPLSVPRLLRCSAPLPVTLAFSVWPAEALTRMGAAAVPMPLAALSVMAALAPLPARVPPPARMLPPLAVRLRVLALP